LRYDERREVNKKKVHRLWREEGLQVRAHSTGKRAWVSSVPPIIADAPNMVWAIDFQFDSTVDGKAVKIASMLDEHTRMSLLNVVERSITAERLVAELDAVFAAVGGPPKVLRMDNGPEFISQVLQQFCDGKTGMICIPRQRGRGACWFRRCASTFPVTTSQAAVPRALPQPTSRLRRLA
jgi:putative transposase